MTSPFYKSNKHVKVNKKHKFTGTTALHLSVNKNDIKSVKILLKYSAPMRHITNESKISPLSIAQRHKYREILDEFGEDSKTDTDENEIGSKKVQFSMDKPVKNDHNFFVCVCRGYIVGQS